MSKYVFEYNNLRRTVSSSIDSTNSQLDNAISIASNMVVPSGFSQGATLHNIRSKIGNIKSELARVKGWIETSNNRFESNERDIIAGIISIPDNKIPKRDHAVRKVI